MADGVIHLSTPARPLVSEPQRSSFIAASSKTQHELKSAVHHELIKRVDLEKLGVLQGNRGGQSQLTSIIQQLIAEQGTPLSSVERDRLGQEVLDELFGLGPLEPLLQDPTVN